MREALLEEAERRLAIAQDPDQPEAIARIEKEIHEGLMREATSRGAARVCNICEVGIPQARIAAYPGVQRCVACQEKIEKERRR